MQMAMEELWMATPSDSAVRTHGRTSDQVSGFIWDVCQISTGRAGGSANASNYRAFFTRGVDVVYRGFIDNYNQSIHFTKMVQPEP